MGKKTKIAILSMQRIVNSGSVLQAWSLKTMLEEISSAEISFLDIEDSPALKSKKTISDKADYSAEVRYPPGILQRGRRWCIARLSAMNKKLIRRFMVKELGLRAQASPGRYDCVVVGSDEVFNHSKGIRLQLHGNVPQAEKLISYAASCGSALPEDIYPEDTEQVKKAMSNFSALSLRDAGTERYISKLYEGPVYRHLDPVLVGTLRERKVRSVPMKNYLLVYAYGQRIRTEEEINAIRSFARERKLKTVAMGGSQFWCDLYIPSSPFRLLDWFAHADFVVTDTFHGVIFSVINHRKFAAISRLSNKNKMSGLLESLGLEDRNLADMAELPRVLECEIDYEAVDMLLDSEREKTTAYLKDYLGEL